MESRGDEEKRTNVRGTKERQSVRPRMHVRARGLLRGTGLFAYVESGGFEDEHMAMSSG